ncbi:MAG: HAD-IA family hydrolase [Eubacteriales bacterium]|nr:HAD-IA family hydrolase [Eubacteriales bacterium]
MRYKNYVFDMGKVLVDYDAHLACKQFTNDERIIEESFNVLFCSMEWAYLDCGLISDDEAWNSLSKRIKNEEVKRVSKECLYHWEEYCLWEIKGMKEILKQIKDNASNIYLLSNVNSHIIHVQDKYMPYPELFSGKCFSFDVNLMKPQKEIYKKFFNMFDLDPKTCFFIDDLPWNIKGAKECGMDGYIHKNCDIEKLKKVLFEN